MCSPTQMRDAAVDRITIAEPLAELVRSNIATMSGPGPALRAVIDGDTARDRTMSPR